MKRNYLIVAECSQARENLAVELRSRGYSVTLAANLKEGERVARDVALDVALIVAKAGDDVTAKTQKLKRIRPNCRVVAMGRPDRTEERQLKELIDSNNIYTIDRDELLDLLPVAREQAADSTFEQRGIDSLVQVVDVLVGLLEVDEKFFSGSSHKVMRLARLLCESMSVDTETQREIVLATLLRDIGKVSLDPTLLISKKSFDADEQRRMHDHVISSERLLEHIEFPWKIMSIIRHHHERYDGNGYPDGLRGREIPMGARIVAVVDAYVAMTSTRSHRKALETEAALQELIDHTGTQFDPEVVEKFQRVLDQQSRVVENDASPRVLLVEPEEEFRKVLKLRLINDGFEVESSDSNERALESVINSAPDLLVADLDADNEETFQLMREIREDPSLGCIPFVMMSSNLDRVLKLRALREGVDEFLYKHQDTEEIAAHLQNIVTRETLRRNRAAVRTRRGITGSLEQLGLADIVQTLVIGMKTARISLSSASSQGQIWFENGSPRHAESNDLAGEEAFYEMLRWNTGEFVIEHGVRGEVHSLQHDAMFLLMEGLRLLDESTQTETVSG